MPESRDAKYWLTRALELAEQNAASGRGGPFGAVIVRGGELVSEGVNLVTTTFDPTAHAEVVAIRHAGAKLQRFELSDCELYASCEPCPMCAGAALWARLKGLWFAATQAEAAAAGFDDASFYDEFQRPPDVWRTPMRHVPTARATAPFVAWQMFAGRVRY